MRPLSLELLDLAGYSRCGTLISFTAWDLPWDLDHICSMRLVVASAYEGLMSTFAMWDIGHLCYRILIASAMRLLLPQLVTCLVGSLALQLVVFAFWDICRRQLVNFASWNLYCFSWLLPLCKNFDCFRYEILIDSAMWNLVVSATCDLYRIFLGTTLVASVM